MDSLMLHWDGVIDLQDVWAAGDCWHATSDSDLKDWSLQRAFWITKP